MEKLSSDKVLDESLLPVSPAPHPLLAPLIGHDHPGGEKVLQSRDKSLKPEGGGVAKVCRAFGLQQPLVWAGEGRRGD